MSFGRLTQMLEMNFEVQMDLKAEVQSMHLALKRGLASKRGAPAG